jgi:glycosyltransferase involved in cell wall biosynthesis
VNRVLSDKKYREKIEKNAYEYSRAWTWPKIADSYVSLFEGIEK